MPIDAAAVDALLLRARKEVDAGLLPSAQIALAKDGELIAFETYGDATNDTRYCVFSSTKAFVAGAMWALIGDELIDVSKRVVEYIPEFGKHGKEAKEECNFDCLLVLFETTIVRAILPYLIVAIVVACSDKGCCETNAAQTSVHASFLSISLACVFGTNIRFHYGRRRR